MTTSGDRRALERLLGGTETAWLVERVRARAVASGRAPLSGVVVLNSPTPEQRRAAARLVGPPRRTASAALRVDLAAVEEVLRRGLWPAGLVDAVEMLTGPIVDRRALREATAADWARAIERLETGRWPGLAQWWEQWSAAGGLKRAASAEARRTGVALSPEVGSRLVDQINSVLAALPAATEPISVVARRVLGDAHGLDQDRPVGRLTVAVLGAALAPEESGLSARDVWARAGVVMSNVASTVLCLGVPGARSPDPRVGVATATMLDAMQTARMPVVLTLDQVRSQGVAALPADRTVHVCENPSVVEVVAERWAASPAGQPVLVCTSGQPSTAVVELLRVLTAGGAGCRYHGDFDWAGLRIAETLRRQVPWSPWRYGATDYRAAIAAETPSRRLSGARAESPWDPALSTAMAAAGDAVEEEAVADLLAHDLVDPGIPTRRSGRRTRHKH